MEMWGFNFDPKEASMSAHLTNMNRKLWIKAAFAWCWLQSFSMADSWNFISTRSRLWCLCLFVNRFVMKCLSARIGDCRSYAKDGAIETSFTACVGLKMWMLWKCEMMMCLCWVLLFFCNTRLSSLVKFSVVWCAKLLQFCWGHNKM